MIYDFTAETHFLIFANLNPKSLNKSAGSFSYDVLLTATKIHPTFKLIRKTLARIIPDSSFKSDFFPSTMKD